MQPAIVRHIKNGDEPMRGRLISTEPRECVDETLYISGKQ
jgi:hypothetical protein